MFFHIRNFCLENNAKDIFSILKHKKIFPNDPIPSAGGLNQDGVAEKQTADLGEEGQPSDLLTPRLVNGPLKICALNSSFLVLMRAFPGILAILRRGRLPVESLAHQIQKVLNSKDLKGTDLLGVKYVLFKNHPHTVSYQPGETGGYAVESFEHMLEDFLKEVGGNKTWRHCRTVVEERGYPATCCSQNLQYEETATKDGVFMILKDTVAGQACSIQTSIDWWENNEQKAVRDVTCPTCSQKHTIQVVSMPTHMPSLLTLQFNPHAVTVTDINGEISWGGAAFTPIGAIHHDDGHFYASLRDGGRGKDWWRFDDFCSEDLWRRKYVEGQTLGSAGRSVHKLGEKIALLLLEKKDSVEGDEGQV